MSKIVKCDSCEQEIGDEVTANDVIYYAIVEKLPCMSIQEDKWDVCQTCWNRMRRLRREEMEKSFRERLIDG